MRRPETSFFPTCGTYFYLINQPIARAAVQYMTQSTFLNDIGRLWSNPVDMVRSYRLYPRGMITAATTTEKLTIGGIDIQGPAGDISASRIQELCAPIPLGSITVPPGFGDFRDLEPYTSITIYLPLFGTRSLEPSDVLNRNISVSYAVDVTTGEALVEVATGNTPLLIETKKVAIDVSVGATQTGEATQSAILGVAAAAVSAATAAAAPLAGVATAASLGGVIANTRVRPYSVGNAGGTLPYYESNFPYITIRRPSANFASAAYYNDQGCPSAAYAAVLINAPDGYYEIDADVCIDNATVDEINEIKRLLHGGIHK